ncbi:MAG TPA: carboxypeptidase-like regulatory domain-containing protein [Bryobacteraceae bacterium]
MTFTRLIPYTVCTLILALSSAAFAQSTIQGVVKDNVGNGMEGVNVQVNVAGTNRTAKTDKDGRYSFANVPQGGYIVSFEVDRYAPVKKQVKVPENGKVSVDATMNPEETVSLPRFYAALLRQYF